MEADEIEWSKEGAARTLDFGRESFVAVGDRGTLVLLAVFVDERRDVQPVSLERIFLLLLIPAFV